MYFYGGEPLCYHSVLQCYYLLPCSLICFRKGQSTQDAFLLFKEETLAKRNNKDQITLTLGLTGEFHNVAHEAVLEALNNIGSGEPIYSLVLG